MQLRWPGSYGLTDNLGVIKTEQKGHFSADSVPVGGTIQVPHAANAINETVSLGGESLFAFAPSRHVCTQ